MTLYKALQEGLLRQIWPLPLIAAIGVSLSGCNLANGPKAEINHETKFSQAEYQVKSSPRVTESKVVRKGGGRYQVGKPYKIRGKWYTPKEDPSYAAVGQASWYGPNFHGRLTANGEIYNQYALSAAHPTLPLPSYARVTNLENGSSLIVRVNDRGPFAHGRVIDLSSRAAEMLGYRSAGVTDVKVEYVGKARMDGRDERFLMASYRAPFGNGVVPGASQSGTLLALDNSGSSKLEEAPLLAQVDQVLVAAATLPIPSPRPGVLAGGLPLDVAGEIQLASLQPLGFMRTDDAFDARLAASFRAVDLGKVDGTDTSSQAVVVTISGFETQEAAEAAQRDISDLGLSHLHASERGIELSLFVGADVAGSVFLAIKGRGYSASYRQ